MRRLAQFVFLFSLCSIAHAQMSPTPAQHKRLMEHRAKIVKLQDQITRLQTELSFQISQLGLESARIVIENRWPANTQFNAQTFGFLEPAPQPASSPAQTPVPLMQTPSSGQPTTEKK